MAKHAADKIRYRCLGCKKTLATSRRRDKHAKQHATCDICDKTFPRLSELKRHKATHTELNKRNVFQCPVCCKPFKTQKGCDGHFDREHGLQNERAEHNKKIKCFYCSEKLSDKDKRNDHIRKTHSGKRFCECEICGDVFTRQFFLRRHMKVHSTERPFKCEFCYHTFKHEFNLAQHNCVAIRKSAGNNGRIYMHPMGAYRLF